MYSMNRYNKGQSSDMAEKMGRRKGRVAIKDEERSKECRTTTETIIPTEKTQLDEVCHRFSSRSSQSKSAVDATVTRLDRKKRSKDVSTKIAIQTCKGEDTSRSTTAQPSTPPSAFRVSNKKHQTKKTVSSISKGVKTTSEKAVPVENSSAKSLKCDSEEVCFPETNQNTESPCVKDDARQQNKRDDHKIALLSSKEEPNLSSLKSPKRPNCPPEDETFIVGNGKRKRQRQSDYSQPEDYKGSEIGSGLEDRGNNQSGCEGNENKPHVNLSFKPEQMREKKFLYDVPDTSDCSSEDQNCTTKMPDQPFEVHTSWEDCAVPEIEKIVDGRIEDLDLNTDNSAPIKIMDFLHYARVIDYLIRVWWKQEKHDRQDVTLLVSRFTVRLQASNLYCCPIKKDEEEIHLHDKNLNYAKLKPSKETAKYYSETVWNYMVGNHAKVESYVLTPQDAIAVCAVLFSEVIRYPSMFFHNILLMQYCKSWSKFCDYHPMITGGSWKYQSNDEIVPEKVLKREQENLVFCAKKIMSDEGKRSKPFQVTSPVRRTRTLENTLMDSCGSQNVLI